MSACAALDRFTIVTARPAQPHEHLIGILRLPPQDPALALDLAAGAKRSGLGARHDPLGGS